MLVRETASRFSALSATPAPHVVATAKPDAAVAASDTFAVGAGVSAAGESLGVRGADVFRRRIPGSYIIAVATDGSLPALADVTVDRVLGKVDRPGTSPEQVVWVEVHSPINLTDRVRATDYPEIIWAAPNYEYHGQLTESVPAHAMRAGALDPLVGKQHHLNVMHAIEAWKVQAGNPDIVVAVTDNGTDIEHEDLKGSLWTNPDEIPGNGIDDDDNGLVDDVHGWNFSGDNDRIKGGSHGCHTVGLVGAEGGNGIGVSGTAPGVSMMPIKWDGDGGWTSAVIAASYLYAANSGARIVSTSYNIDRWPGDSVVEKALDYMESKGMLHFNSAGNGRAHQPNRTRLKNVILVASTEADVKHDDEKSSFSNYGAGIDIAAPGGGREDILSTVNDHRYGGMSGTSMASPNAAGVAALIWSAHPEWSREQVYAQMVGTADNIDAQNPKYIDQLGAGRVNALRAVTETIAPPRVSAKMTGDSVSLRLRSVFDQTAVNQPEAFRIERVDTGEVISQGAPQRVRIATNELTWSLRDLPAGKYRLVGSAEHLVDPFGQALDGDANGESGDDFVFEFEVP